MKFSAVARAVSTLCVLTCCGLWAGCGSGSAAQGQGATAKLTQINVTPANQSLAKGKSLQLSATGVYDNGTTQSISTLVSWQSSQAGIAQIDTDGVVIALAQGISQVSATYQGVTGSTAVTIGQPALLNIAVGPNQSSLPLGESEQLAATGAFSDGTAQDLTQSVTWSSSALPIAAVNPQGVVTGMGAGVAQVSAAYEGVTGSTAVTVGQPALLGITVAPNPSSLPLGESEQLTATGAFSDGTTQDLTQSATWSSTAVAIAVVNAQGVVTSLGEGIAQVSAAYQGMTSGTALTVGAPALLNIAVGPNQSSLPLGETEQLTATGTFSNGANQNLTQSAKWSSSSSTIANVNAQGVVTGMGAGIAQLSAAYQGITGSTAVAVGQPALLSLTVGPNPFSLPLGETGQFTAIGRFSDGSTQNLTQSVTWGSSSPAIASVSPAGTAVANAVGAVTVSAASAAVTGSASLTVSPPVVVGLSIVPGNLSIVIEGSRPLQAMATMSDGTTQNMTAAVAWSSAEPDVASVNNGGMVIAEQVGSTTIVAQTSGFSAAAGVTVTPLMTVNYFNRASAVQTGVDGSLQLTNPGVTPGDLCAMVYVLDQTQVLSECCGCSISDGGLRSLSLLNDLTANPLTGKQPQVGVIMVVPSNPGQNGQCDAGASNPNGVVLGWQSNPVAVSGGTSQITETSSSLVALNSVEAAVLVSECSMVEQLGSGNGICSCGKGD